MTSRSRTRHGLSRELARIRLAGWRVIDRRSAGGRDLVQLKAQLVADCGGEANVTAARMEHIDLACRMRAQIVHGHEYLLSQTSIVNRRKKSFVPLVAQLQTLTNDYLRILREIGMERIAAPGSLDPECVEKILATEREQEEKESDDEPNRRSGTDGTLSHED